MFISPQLDNAFGPLKPEIRKRLVQVHKNPRRFWDRDHGIILRWSLRSLTLWQAILEVDPTFPRTGPTSNAAGRVITSWARYPTPELVERALLFAAPAPEVVS
jgi:hypothetical protein